MNELILPGSNCWNYYLVTLSCSQVPVNHLKLVQYSMLTISWSPNELQMIGWHCSSSYYGHQVTIQIRGYTLLPGYSFFQGVNGQLCLLTSISFTAAIITLSHTYQLAHLKAVTVSVTMILKKHNRYQLLLHETGLTLYGLVATHYLNQQLSIFNSSPPSARYLHQWTGSALVQIMACRLFGAKLLP